MLGWRNDQQCFCATGAPFVPIPGNHRLNHGWQLQVMQNEARVYGSHDSILAPASLAFDLFLDPIQSIGLDTFGVSRFRPRVLVQTPLEFEMDWAQDTWRLFSPKWTCPPGQIGLLGLPKGHNLLPKIWVDILCGSSKATCEGSCVMIHCPLPWTYWCVFL